MNTQPEAIRLAEVFETYAVDHQPDGWPAIRQETLNSAAAELRRLHAENEALRVALEQQAVEPQQLKSPCARQCEAQAFKIEIRQLTRLVADYMEIIAKQRVAMKEAHRVLGTLDVSITSRTLGARCGLAEAMELGISAPQPAQQPGVESERGWKLVPVEPTPEMLQAGRDVECTASDDDCAEDYRAVYKAMMAAAPQPAQQPNTDALLRQSLEALEKGIDYMPWKTEAVRRQKETITAIRKHLGEE